MKYTGMISPKFKLGNFKEEEGSVIVHGTAGIFSHGCILYFKVGGMVGTLVLLHYHLYSMPTHRVFPSVLPDRTSILFRDPPSLHASYWGLGEADPPLGWGCMDSLV